MADGKIDAEELKAQEARRVAALMKTVEPELDDKLHEQVTHLLCELSAYNIMHTLHQLVEQAQDQVPGLRGHLKARRGLPGRVSRAERGVTHRSAPAHAVGRSKATTRSALTLQAIEGSRDGA